MLGLFKKYRRELVLFAAAVAMLGFGDSIVNSVLNNFLDDKYQLTSVQRTLLELPRELPGFLLVFISAALFFLRSRRLAVFASILGALGLVCIALFPGRYSIFCIWMFLLSVGQHLLMPLISSVGMELAREGQDGRRLGQINSIRNIATVLGSIFVFLGFKYLHFTFAVSFILAAVVYLAAAFFFYGMNPGQAHPASVRLKLHKEYRLYYWLAILFGTRKQIFLTFAPWVLVTIYHKPTTTLAILLLLGGVAGIVFQPILGSAIDRLGERVVLSTEAAILIFVCIGYGFAEFLLPEKLAFLLVATCFILDQLLISVSMARATYLKKIALHPDHITPTLNMAVTIDHAFSILVAVFGGLIWKYAGYQYVFLFGSAIAITNLFSALRIRIPRKNPVISN